MTVPDHSSRAHYVALGTIFITQVVSLILSASQAVGLSLFAATQLGGATQLASLLVSLSIGRVGGSLVARLVTRSRSGVFLLVLSDVVGAVCAASMSVLLGQETGSLLAFIPIFFFLGVASGLYAPASSMLVRDLVPEHHRPRANGVAELGTQVFALAGAPIGVYVHAHGLLQATAIVNTASYVVAVIASISMLLRTDRRPSGQDAPADAASWGRAMRVAWVRALLICSFGGTLFTQGLFSVALPVGASTDGGSTSRLSWWLVAFGIGNLVGLRAGARWSASKGRTPIATILTLELTQAVALIVFALSPTPAQVIVIAAAGFANCAATVYMVSLTQRALSRSLFFAYRSLSMFLTAVAIPVSQWGAGRLFDHLSFTTGWLVGSAAFLANVGVVAVLLVQPSARRLLGGTATKPVDGMCAAGPGNTQRARPATSAVDDTACLSHDESAS